MDSKDDARDGDGENRGDEKEGAEAEETERESSEPPPPPKAEAKRSKDPESKPGRTGKAKREGKSRAQEDAKRAPAASAPAKGSSQAIVIAVVALAAGAAIGWFGHQTRAKAKIQAESSPATAGSAGPCGQWQEKICADTGGERSAACQQAKSASELLTPGTCETALLAMPATLDKIKAGRATCDNLVTKLCNDLPKDSSACTMVKERTPSFPSDRCKGMLDQYDQVLAQLKMIDQQGAGMMGRPPGGPSPHGGPPGGPGGPPGGPGGPPGGPSPHGGPPGSDPHQSH